MPLEKAYPVPGYKLPLVHVSGGRTVPSWVVIKKGLLSVDVVASYSKEPVRYPLLYKVAFSTYHVIGLALSSAPIRDRANKDRRVKHRADRLLFV